MTGENENELLAQRRAKLDKLREQGNPFPNFFKRDALAQKLHEEYDGFDKEILESRSVRVRVAGRMMSRRVMGKASFVHIQDTIHIRIDPTEPFGYFNGIHK